MSATKSAKKSAKPQAPKAKGKTKPVAKKAEPKSAPKPKTDECVKGGQHVWKVEDGDRYCEKCFEPASKPKKTKLARVPRTNSDEQVQAAEIEPARVENETAKPPKAKKVAEPKATKKLSAIDAAVKVLAETGEAMNCVSLIEAMATKGYWTSPGGKTPHATLYSAILREVGTKGKEARFVKTERGKFEANAKA